MLVSPKQLGKPPVAVILAAGKGTRMNSDLPKVVHAVGDRPMVCNVVDACRAAGARRIILVVGYKQEVVREAVARQGPAWAHGIEFAVQQEQLGTGHAVLAAKEALADLLQTRQQPCFVLAGDGPLIRSKTLRTLLDRHNEASASATLATSVIPDPTGYGRIVRDEAGRFVAIVEHKECTPEQRALQEVNPSYYCFDLHELYKGLAQVERNGSSGEYYITDVPSLFLRQGKRVEVIDAVPPQDVLSINTPAQLAEVDAIYRAQVIDAQRASRDESHSLRVFAGRRALELTNRVCAHIGVPMGVARTEQFPDGELLVRIEEDVRGRDCFVVLGTSQPVNDNLIELLVFTDCLRRASAKRITAVMPYFGYARQDRKDEGRVPITAKLVANLMAAARIDRVITVDLHAAQIQGFFDIPLDHLSATPVFYDYFMSMRRELGDLVMLSPDVGNVKVAESFANMLGAELAIVNKRRISGSEVVTDRLIGSVSNKTVLLFDDMIATGGTVAQAAQLARQHGARHVIAAATHGVLAGSAIEKLAGPEIDRIVITNTIPSNTALHPGADPVADRLAPLRHKIVELDVADLLGEAIHRINKNLSISALFKKTAGAKR
ncbi:MAG: ribose-phosphate diphosphokinase [bacterium]